MIVNNCYKSILQKLSGITVYQDYNVGKLTRYQTGGNADLYILPKTESEFIKSLEAVKGICPCFILGGGNNLLVSDQGFKGAVIHTKNLCRREIKGNLYLAECGVKMQTVVDDMRLNALSGLEFAVGIPATVGGAVCMNAGCFGKSVGDLVCYVVTENGVINKSECKFSYRSSRFLVNDEAVIKVCFSLRPSEIDIIEEKIKSYKNTRHNPKGKSCGSVFKNDGCFAGKVIDECGLKGLSVGGATVSKEHANFIIANGKCTSKDVYDLILEVKSKVYEKTKIKLCEELVYLGEF